MLLAGNTVPGSVCLVVPALPQRMLGRAGYFRGLRLPVCKMALPTLSESLSLDFENDRGHSPHVWGAIMSVRRACVTPFAVQDRDTVAMFLWKLLVTFLFPASYRMTGLLHPKPSTLGNKMSCPAPALPTNAQKLKYLVFFSMTWPTNQLTQHLIQLLLAVSGRAEAEM